jgi:hypothetical protein
MTDDLVSNPSLEERLNHLHEDDRQLVLGSANPDRVLDIISYFHDADPQVNPIEVALAIIGSTDPVAYCKGIGCLPEEDHELLVWLVRSWTWFEPEPVPIMSAKTRRALLEFYYDSSDSHGADRIPDDYPVTRNSLHRHWYLFALSESMYDGDTVGRLKRYGAYQGMPFEWDDGYICEHQYIDVIGDVIESPYPLQVIHLVTQYFCCRGGCYTTCSIPTAVAVFSAPDPVARLEKEMKPRSRVPEDGPGCWRCVYIDEGEEEWNEWAKAQEDALEFVKRWKAGLTILQTWQEARLNPYCQLGRNKINADYDSYVNAAP